MINSINFKSILNSHLHPVVPLFTGVSVGRNLKWRGTAAEFTYNSYLRNGWVVIDTGLKTASGTPIIEFSTWESSKSNETLVFPNTLSYKFFISTGAWQTAYLTRTSVSAAENWFMKGKSALSLFDTYVSERSAGRVSQLFLYKPTYSIAKNLAFLIHKSRSASTSLSIAARNFDNFFERFSYIYSNSRQMLKFASRIQASKKEVAWFMLNDRVGILYSRLHHVLPSVALFCKFFLTSFTNKLIHRVSYSSRRVRSFPRGAFFVDPKLITVYSLVFRLNTIALLYVRANINPSLHVLVKALLKTTLLKIVYLLVSRSKAGIHKPLALSLQLRNFFYSRALFLLQHSRLCARNVSRLLVRYVLSYTAFMCRRPKIFTRPRLSTRKLDLKSRLTYKFKLAQSAILLAEARKQTKGVRTATYNAQQFFTNYAKVRAHYIFKLKTFWKRRSVVSKNNFRSFKSKKRKPKRALAYTSRRHVRPWRNLVSYFKASFARKQFFFISFWSFNFFNLSLADQRSSTKRSFFRVARLIQFFRKFFKFFKFYSFYFGLLRTLAGSRAASRSTNFFVNLKAFIWILQVKLWRLLRAFHGLCGKFFVRRWRSISKTLKSFRSKFATSNKLFFAKSKKYRSLRKFKPRFSLNGGLLSRTVVWLMVKNYLSYLKKLAFRNSHRPIRLAVRRTYLKFLLNLRRQSAELISSVTSSSNKFSRFGNELQSESERAAAVPLMTLFENGFFTTLGNLRKPFTAHFLQLTAIVKVLNEAYLNKSFPVLTFPVVKFLFLFTGFMKRYSSKAWKQKSAPLYRLVRPLVAALLRLTRRSILSAKKLPAFSSQTINMHNSRTGRVNASSFFLPPSITFFCYLVRLAATLRVAGSNSFRPNRFALKVRRLLSRSTKRVSRLAHIGASPHHKIFSTYDASLSEYSHLVLKKNLLLLRSALELRRKIMALSSAHRYRAAVLSGVHLYNYLVSYSRLSSLFRLTTNFEQTFFRVGLAPRSLVLSSVFTTRGCAFFRSPLVGEFSGVHTAGSTVVDFLALINETLSGPIRAARPITATNSLASTFLTSLQAFNYRILSSSPWYSTTTDFPMVAPVVALLYYILPSHHNVSLSLFTVLNTAYFFTSYVRWYTYFVSKRLLYSYGSTSQALACVLQMLAKRRAEAADIKFNPRFIQHRKFLKTAFTCRTVKRTPLPSMFREFFIKSRFLSIASIRAANLSCRFAAFFTNPLKHVTPAFKSSSKLTSLFYRATTADLLLKQYSKFINRVLHKWSIIREFRALIGRRGRKSFRGNQLARKCGKARYNSIRKAYLERKPYQGFLRRRRRSNYKVARKFLRRLKSLTRVRPIFTWRDIAIRRVEIRIRQRIGKRKKVFKRRRFMGFRWKSRFVKRRRFIATSPGPWRSRILSVFYARKGFRARLRSLEARRLGRALALKSRLLRSARRLSRRTSRKRGLIFCALALRNYYRRRRETSHISPLLVSRLYNIRSEYIFNHSIDSFRALGDAGGAVHRLKPFTAIRAAARISSSPYKQAVARLRTTDHPVHVLRSAPTICLLKRYMGAFLNALRLSCVKYKLLPRRNFILHRSAFFRKVRLAPKVLLQSNARKRGLLRRTSPLRTPLRYALRKVKYRYRSKKAHLRGKPIRVDVRKFTPRWEHLRGKRRRFPKFNKFRRTSNRFSKFSKPRKMNDFVARAKLSKRRKLTTKYNAKKRIKPSSLPSLFDKSNVQSMQLTLDFRHERFKFIKINSAWQLRKRTRLMYRSLARHLYFKFWGKINSHLFWTKFHRILTRSKLYKRFKRRKKYYFKRVCRRRLGFIFKTALLHATQRLRNLRALHNVHNLNYIRKVTLFVSRLRKSSLRRRSAYSILHSLLLRKFMLALYSRFSSYRTVVRLNLFKELKFTFVFKLVSFFFKRVFILFSSFVALTKFSVSSSSNFISFVNKFATSLVKKLTLAQSPLDTSRTFEQDVLSVTVVRGLNNRVYNATPPFLYSDLSFFHLAGFASAFRTFTAVYSLAIFETAGSLKIWSRVTRRFRVKNRFSRLLAISRLPVYSKPYRKLRAARHLFKRRLRNKRYKVRGSRLLLKSFLAGNRRLVQRVALSAFPKLSIRTFKRLRRIPIPSVRAKLLLPFFKVLRRLIVAEPFAPKKAFHNPESYPLVQNFGIRRGARLLNRLLKRADYRPLQKPINRVFSKLNRLARKRLSLRYSESQARKFNRYVTRLGRKIPAPVVNLLRNRWRRAAKRPHRRKFNFVRKYLDEKSKSSLVSFASLENSSTRASRASPARSQIFRRYWGFPSLSFKRRTHWNRHFPRVPRRYKSSLSAFSRLRHRRRLLTRLIYRRRSYDTRFFKNVPNLLGPRSESFL